MKALPFAGLVGLASLGAQAQVPALKLSHSLDAVVVTATRSLRPDATTLREATVITREDLENAGSQSLHDVLLRRAGVEFRATGGPGQPVGLFLRGAGTAQTLVLVDGMRVGSATIGTTSIENIPLELIERVEVVKGPMSSLYGSDAMGGVVQVFTRGKSVPHVHASLGYGDDNDTRLSAGVTGADNSTSFSISGGARKVDAPSATNSRAFCHDPDRDPYENAFAEAKVSHKLWQGETLSFTSFISRGKTHFDGCRDAAGVQHDDVNDQTILGIGLASTTQFAPWWTSKLTYGHGRDEIETSGGSQSRFETRQDQIAWLNEFPLATGTSVLVGLEGLRQQVYSDLAFSKDQRDTWSAFTGVAENWQGQQIEASIRRDEDDQFGGRTTGSASWATAWPGVGLLSLTYGEGFRAPSFFDLYGPASDFYLPNPELKPERSKSTEVSLKSEAGKRWAWRVTAFDNEIEDLITYDFTTTSVHNIARARIKGVEFSGSTLGYGVRWRANVTVQRPRDDDTGYRLQGRSEAFGTIEGSRTFGAWTIGVTALGMGDRFDSRNESPASRLPGYGLLDARVKYVINHRWSAELSATNLLDKRYETAVGYDAPRRGLFLKAMIEAF